MQIPDASGTFQASTTEGEFRAKAAARAAREPATCFQCGSPAWFMLQVRRRWTGACRTHRDALQRLAVAARDRQRHAGVTENGGRDA